MKNHEQEPNIGRMEFLLELRARGISNQSVLRAMDEVPRAEFVDAELAGQAYSNRALPIACGQTISQPYVVAYMTEQLELRPHHRVLEVGTGSGYQAAVLSKLVQEVVSIERYRTLADQARQKLKAIGCENVQVVVGDGFLGLREKAPFDRIIVTAAVEEAPQALIDQLAVGGIMLVPIGPQSGVQHIVKLTKSEDWVSRDDLIPVRFVPLVRGQAAEL